MTRSSFYRTFEHTADLGIEVIASTLPELYENAAHAMFTEMLGRTPHAGGTEYMVRVYGEDREELLVRWLNELLYLSEARGVAFGEYLDLELGTGELAARCLGAVPEESGMEIKTEIKAATYHQISVEQTADGYRARIVFDL